MVFPNRYAASLNLEFEELFCRKPAKSPNRKVRHRTIPTQYSGFLELRRQTNVSIGLNRFEKLVSHQHELYTAIVELDDTVSYAARILCFFYLILCFSYFHIISCSCAAFLTISTLSYRFLVLMTYICCSGFCQAMMSFLQHDGAEKIRSG